MKVVVIHGEDIASSRDRFGKIIAGSKKKGFEIVRMSGEESDVDQITTKGMFSSQQLFVVTDFKRIDERVYGSNLGGNLLIWHKGEFPKIFAKKLPKDAKYEKFDLPKIIYNFLDSILPNNIDNCLMLLHELLKTNPPEMVAAIINTHLRDIWIALEDARQLKYPAWRLGKLQRQGERLGKTKVEFMIKALASADIKSKTGEGDLSLMLDLIIVKALK